MKKKTILLKNTLLVTAILLVSFLNAQVEETLTVPLSKPNQDGKLIVNIIDGSINVSGYDGNEVRVIGSSRNKSKAHNKSKNKNNSRDGMKKITDSGLSFTVEEVNNTVYIKRSPSGSVIDFEVQVPRNFSVDLKTLNGGIIIVDNVNGTHEVSNTNGKITMTNVGGSVVADALNDDITVTFRTISDNTTMMFTSLNGDLDITFPSSLKANVKARSDFGNVYTDFEIVLDKSKPAIKTSNKSGVYQVKKKKGVYGTINGGGSDITFKTMNGDVLIRSN